MIECHGGVLRELSMSRQGQPQRCVEWIFHRRLSMSGRFLKLDVLHVVIVCICHARMLSAFNRLYLTNHLDVLSSNLGYAPGTFNVPARDCCKDENVAS